MDLKNIKEFEKLVKFCRKNGITSVKSADFEMQFAKEALFPESPYKQRKQNEADSEIQSPDSYSEEEILMWSSTGAEGAH